MNKLVERLVIGLIKREQLKARHALELKSHEMIADFITGVIALCAISAFFVWAK